MNNWLLIPLISFFCFFIGVLRTYYLMRKILSLVKEIDYEKWNFLMSSSIPFLNNLIGEKSVIWVNSVRFGKFVRGGEYFNDPQLERYVRLYRRNKVVAFLCWVACMVSIPLLAFAHS